MPRVVQHVPPVRPSLPGAALQPTPLKQWVSNVGRQPVLVYHEVMPACRLTQMAGQPLRLGPPTGPSRPTSQRSTAPNAHAFPALPSA